MNNFQQDLEVTSNLYTNAFLKTKTFLDHLWSCAILIKTFLIFFPGSNFVCFNTSPSMLA